MWPDMELRHLKGLKTRLEKLWLNGTQVTGVGLDNLKGLNKLHTLCLDDTQVKNTELEHLKGLTQLRFLSLGTNITAKGREELQRALPDCTICGPLVLSHKPHARCWTTLRCFWRPSG